MQSDTLRYVTRRYPQLQGLRLLPVALVFLLSGAWRAGWLALPAAASPRATTIWFFGSLTAAVVVSYAIRSWYLRRFGSVSPRVVHSAAISLVLVTLGVFACVAIQEQLNWSFSLPVGFVGAVMLSMGVTQYPTRRHYLAIAVLCLVFASLGVFGASLAVRDASFDVTLGLALVIAGVGDHLVLVRTLHPVPSGDE